ncbi:uncharacterized protein C05D11.1-like [Bradysia coprophila]|uniref:uncharacterized protein C05D11.1-like n=1 Tax=Bradysia coprophila TaxID=38358 RepID=UPI00187DD762|nr:uncharacterized protein C05D11.1-like [Bradysia coprophila]XP_037047630.1 uncharacterized protein C05D11.1-like [Bradysia coprophila]
MATLKLLVSANANGTVPVAKYESPSTGLKVVVANVEGPLCCGFFVVATEAHDDDGLPHTLEHLIFLGSEEYPYKGVLDLLANRCLASGTNAWTDTDHTCYTMTTAGKDGFLELLPIYLDHVLFPTLTDSGFITEVHHISGEGEDGGVVYCEMQGRENSGESRTHLELIRAIYPNCGYSSETGGIMHNLRTSTTNKKVRQYHADFYRPENLTCIIAGQIDIEEISRALAPLEKKILSKPLKEAFVRPWQTPVASFNESVNKKVEYPADEEDCGLLSIGWRGPKCTTENLKLTSCSVLMRYLSDTSVSPLQREFVEIPDPFASQISFNIVENTESLLYFTFENVPLDKIEAILPKLQSILKNIADGIEKIDTNRLRNILERSILEYLSNLESNPHEAISFMVIGDVLYGNTPDDFDMRLNVHKQLEYLQTVNESYWLDLLKEYMIDSKYAVIKGYPSIAEQQRIAQDKDRIEKQREELGPEGLETKAAELLDAMTKNAIPPPDKMLTEVPIPSTDGIHFHPSNIYRTGDPDDLPAGLDLNAWPVYSEAIDIHTNFVYMIVALNTHSVPKELRPYLLMLLDLIIESPIRDGDTIIPYEEVVTALEKDTITMGTRLGLESNAAFSCGPFSHTASLMIQVETKKYEKGVKWLADLLHHTEFTVDRARVIAAKMANSVTQAKRKGNFVVKELLKSLYYENDTNVKFSSMLYQQKFLNSILTKLGDPEAAKSVLSDLNQVRNIITSTKNLSLHVAADWRKMSSLNIDLNSPWQLIARKDEAPCREKMTIIPDWKIMKSHEKISCHGSVVGMGCIESAFLYHASPSVCSFMDADLPALNLFLQYLTQLEGPLWKQIRGAGLAYGYNLSLMPHEGLLYLALYRATNVTAAFKETKAIIEALLQPDGVWDPTQLESAKSSLIFEVIEREKSVGDLVVQSLLSTFKMVPKDYNRLMVKKINAVTVDDLRRVGQTYVSRLFTDDAKTMITCHPDKANDVATSFLEFGRKLTVQSLDDSLLAQF